MAASITPSMNTGASSTIGVTGTWYHTSNPTMSTDATRRSMIPTPTAASGTIMRGK